MKKKIVLIILIIIWMSIIFLYSNMSGSESLEHSNGFIENTLLKIIEFFNDDLCMENKEILVDMFSTPVRKLAHIFVYFILGILLYSLFTCYEFSNKKIFIFTILICFLYACSDEIHQLLVNGRAGKLIDVLIDTFGSFISCIFMYYFRNFIKSKK